jgi:gliding motility-associatede transport system auxiliary component
MALMSNQTAKKNYTYVALVVALVAFIAAILLGIVRGLVAMGVFTVANVDTLNQAILVSAGITILAIAAYAVLEPERVRQFLTGRQARYGSNALIVTIAFLFILGLVNVLFTNPKFNLNRTKDVTENKTNTLAPETLSALKALPEKVTATAFFASSDPTSATELLNKVRNNSNGKFDYKFVNPDLDPQAAMSAGVTGEGKILLQMGDKSAIVAYASEDEILKGLLRLLNPESSAIYFLTGHGEHDTQQSSDSSMVRAVSTLESKNYSVKPLNLLADNKVPEDARVIVIAGPKKPLSQDEVTLLKGFVDEGGSLIVMEDPSALTNFGEESDPLAEMLSKDWGINFDNDVVIDLNSAQPSIATAAYYDSSHPITVNMNNLVSFFPFARSVSVSDQTNGTTLTQLVRTNERSWGETDFASLSQGGQVGRDDNETLGPLTLAVAGENPTTKGRVVVFGTSEFAVDQIFDRLGNGDMFVNSVDWAAEQENLASITPKNTTERTFTPPSQLYGILIFLVSIFIIPGLIVVSGVSTWLTRRRQG